MSDPFPEVPAAPGWGDEQNAAVTGDYSPQNPRLAEFWGVDTEYGGRLSERRALGISAFWCGVSLISEAMAMMPLQVWKSTKAGGWEHQDQHPTNYCLETSPTGWQTPSAWKSLSQQSLLLGGNSISTIQRNNRGQGVALQFMHLPNVRYFIETNNDPSYAIRDYPLVTSEDQFLQVRGSRSADFVHYDYDEVLHLKAFGLSPYIGLSVLNIARRGLHLTTTIEEFGQKFYDKGRPAGFLSKPGQTIGDTQRDQLRKEWKELYEGAKQFSIGVLSGGLTWEQMGYTNDDAQFLQSREFQVLEIARLLRVPPHMLAEISKATNSNIETLMMDFITFTLLPWIIRWEEELNLKMFTPREQAMGFKCFFDVDAFLRGDSQARANVAEKNIRNGVQTIEEIRLENRWSPYPDGEGKKPLIMASQLDTLERVEAGKSLLQGQPTSPTSKEPASAK